VTNRQPATFDGEGKPEKAAPPIRIGTLEEIRREMAKVNRDMRRGKVETQDGTRLVYVLGELVKVAKAEAEAEAEAGQEATKAVTDSLPGLDVSKLSIETQREIVRARRGMTSEPERVVIRGVLPIRPGQ